MKSVYKEIRKKSIFYNFLFVVTAITSTIIIACVIIFFIAPMFKKNVIAPINIYIFENELSIKVQEEINNAISMNFENIYNRLLSNIQFSIALFSTALVIFAIVFGTIYFSKIKDAEILIREIQKTPELFFKQFYKAQYHMNLSNLFSQNYVNRNDAINKLYYNPEIDKSDYDLFQEVLLNELEYELHVYFHQNISNIIRILIKIDYSRTITLLLRIMKEKKFDSMKHGHLLTHLVNDKSQETVAYIKDQLLNSNGMNNQLVSLLANNGALNDYISYIYEKCDGSVLQTALVMSYSDTWNVNTDELFMHISKREDIEVQCLYSIISHKKIKNEERIALVLHFYSKNTDKFSQAINNLLNTIRNDENAKELFLHIADNNEYRGLIQDYFKKNSYQKTYFASYKDNVLIK